MADKNTNTELSSGEGVYSVIDHTTGETIMSVIRWRSGVLSTLDHGTLPKNKRLKNKMGDALILLATTAQFRKSNGCQ